MGAGQAWLGFSGQEVQDFGAWGFRAWGIGCQSTGSTTQVLVLSGMRLKVWGWGLGSKVPKWGVSENRASQYSTRNSRILTIKDPK